jgi:hypothetical protein
MKMIMVLLIILLSACAKPILKITPSQDCFAPGGFYISVAGLKKHNCKQPPEQTILGLHEVKPNSMRCGFYKSQTPMEGGGTMKLHIEASRRGLIGQALGKSPICQAIYEVIFLRMR